VQILVPEAQVSARPDARDALRLHLVVQPVLGDLEQVAHVVHGQEGDAESSFIAGNRLVGCRYVLG